MEILLSPWKHKIFCSCHDNQLNVGFNDGPLWVVVQFVVGPSNRAPTALLQRHSELRQVKVLIAEVDLAQPRFLMRWNDEGVLLGSLPLRLVRLVYVLRVQGIPRIRHVLVLVLLQTHRQRRVAQQWLVRNKFFHQTTENELVGYGGTELVASDHLIGHHATSFAE